MSYRSYSASLTRPDNATAYTARDTFGTADSNVFTLIPAAVGNGGVIENVHLISNQHTSTDTFEVWFFSESPTAQADNAAFSISDTEALTVLGVVPVTVSYTTAANRVLTPALTTHYEIPYFSKLYAVLVVIGGTTPVAQDKITIVVGVEEDV